MDVIVSTGEVDLQECDLLATGFFQDERPLKGTAGWLDWRLNGLLSHFLIEKRLAGTWKERVLIPSQGRIVPRLIFLVGLGRVKEYSSLRVRELLPSLLGALRKLKISSLSVSLPHGENYNLDCSKLVGVILEGIADFGDEEKGQGRNAWVPPLRISFAEGDEKFSEVLIGVQAAQGILRQRIEMRLFIPSIDQPGTDLAQEGIPSPAQAPESSR
jgi:hypothetical protein